MEVSYHPVFCVSGASFRSIFCSSDQKTVSAGDPIALFKRWNQIVPRSLTFHTPGAATEDILGFFDPFTSWGVSRPSMAESTLESGSVMLIVLDGCESLCYRAIGVEGLCCLFRSEDLSDVVLEVGC